MKIAFHQAQLCERGSTTALFDYARHNQSALGHSSLVVYQRGHPLTHPSQERLFTETFRCRTYERFSEVEGILESERADAFYTIKYGYADDTLVAACPNLVHSIFACEPHGEAYALVSRWMAAVHGGGIPFVPHMVDQPATGADLRGTLGIPADAIVLGRHGGCDTFDIPFVHAAIPKMLDEDRRLHFLFLNTDAFMPRHERVLHLPATVNRLTKAAFINSCDAMLHARLRGETFGLAVAEFSSLNKPVITFSDSPEASHLEILGDKGIHYSEADGLMAILRDIRTLVKSREDWNAYREYSPAAVMRKFDSVFLAACR